MRLKTPLDGGCSQDKCPYLLFLLWKVLLCSANTVFSVYLTATNGLRQSLHFCFKNVFPYRHIVIPHSISTEHFWFWPLKKTGTLRVQFTETFLQWFYRTSGLAFLFIHHFVVITQFCILPVVIFFQFMISSFCIFASCVVSCNDETVFKQLTQPFVSTACKMQ